MPVYLALSCLQGLSARQAVNELMELEPDGIQLTPGNFMDDAFQEWFLDQKVPFMLHEGFDWSLRKRDVWGPGNTCTALEGASVHAPKGYWTFPELKALDRTLEIMYPHSAHNYSIATQEDVVVAATYQIPLAVDISHLDIMGEGHRVEDEVLAVLSAYGGMKEIHVSQAKAICDAHLPITDNTPYLDWALEHVEELPVILECYMHKLTKHQRKEQLKKIKNG